MPKLNLALQGGGAHGAYTWGVLDALLQDERIEIEGLCGTSSGAMNAVILAHAYSQALAQGSEPAEARMIARLALEAFWRQVGSLNGVPAAQMHRWWELASRLMTPWQINPLGFNPLRQLLKKSVDFDFLSRQKDIKLFINATNAKTGEGKIFTTSELTADVVMASACLPTHFQAVEIDGEYYWDGGFTNNPPLFPLIYHTRSRDILLVQITPMKIEDLPDNALDLVDRAAEIGFHANLQAELRVINFISQLLKEGKFETRKYKRVRLHRIYGGDDLAEFGVSSKLRFDSLFISELFDLGRTAGEQWLRWHVADIGKKSTYNLP